MGQRLLLAGSWLLFAALLLAACAEDGDGETTATPGATPEPTATTAADTGDAELDAVLATLFSGDLAAVEAVVRFTQVALRG